MEMIVTGAENFLSAFFQGLEKVEKLLNRRKYSRWFRNLWETNADRYEFYKLANEICRAAFGTSMDKKTWDEAWQFRTVLHPNYKQARIEFVNAVLGWY